MKKKLKTRIKLTKKKGWQKINREKTKKGISTQNRCNKNETFEENKN